MWTSILLKYLRICLQPSLTSSATHSLTTLANDILLIPKVARSHPPKGLCIWCSLTWNSLSLNSLPVISPNSLCLALNLSNYLDFLYHITIFGYLPALTIWYSLLVYLLINFLPFTIRMKAPDHGESYLSFNHFITRAYKTAWHLKRNSMFLKKNITIVILEVLWCGKRHLYSQKFTLISVTVLDFAHGSSQLIWNIYYFYLNRLDLSDYHFM